MSKKNPLSWDLSDIPSHLKRGKVFRSYDHNRRATQDERRMFRQKRLKGITSIQPRKRVDTVESWLPSTNLEVMSRQTFKALKNKYYSSVDELREHLVSENRVIAYFDYEGIAEAGDFLDQFTPFMMLHDIMENIQSEEYIQLNLSNPISKVRDGLGSQDFVFRINDRIYRYQLTDRKLLPLIPNISLSYQKTVDRFYKGDLPRSIIRIPLGTQNILSYNFSDVTSDLFAVWAMKEQIDSDKILFMGDERMGEFLELPLVIYELEEATGQTNFDGQYHLLNEDDIELISMPIVPIHLKQMFVKDINEYFVNALERLKERAIIMI